jgi:hypothetical protein
MEIEIGEEGVSQYGFGHGSLEVVRATAKRGPAPLPAGAERLKVAGRRLRVRPADRHSKTGPARAAAFGSAGGGLRPTAPLA